MFCLGFHTVTKFKTPIETILHNTPTVSWTILRTLVFRSKDSDSWMKTRRVKVSDNKLDLQETSTWPVTENRFWFNNMNRPITLRLIIRRRWIVFPQIDCVIPTSIRVRQTDRGEGLLYQLEIVIFTLELLGSVFLEERTTQHIGSISFPSCTLLFIMNRESEN
jgi:hypothetical protein